MPGSSTPRWPRLESVFLLSGNCNTSEWSIGVIGSCRVVSPWVRLVGGWVGVQGSASGQAVGWLAGTVTGGLSSLLRGGG